VLHPNRLLEELTAAELLEWWHVYIDEPFGELREDFRQVARQRVANGEQQYSLVWPYRQPEATDDEILAEMERIERASHGRTCR
jgi:hypothetical protein